MANATDTKLKRIQALSSKVPIMNEQAAARIAGGRALQVQQAAAAAPANASARQAQQIAPQIAAASGAQQLQQQAAQQQQDVAMGQQAIQTEAQDAQQQLQGQALRQKEELGGQALQQQTALAREEEAMKNSLSEEELASARRLSQLGIETDEQASFLSRKQREDLASLGGDLKEKLFDSRIQFERNEAGRMFSNDRQAADYAIASAQNEQEMNVKMRDMTQAAQREIQMLEVANERIAQALKDGYLDDKRELDQAQREKLIHMKVEAEKDLARKKSRASNQRQVIGGVIMVAGAVVTATGAGAPVGGAMIAGGASYATSGG